MGCAREGVETRRVCAAGCAREVYMSLTQAWSLETLVIRELLRSNSEAHVI